jgi:hypothetical protein
VGARLLRLIAVVKHGTRSTRKADEPGADDRGHWRGESIRSSTSGTSNSATATTIPVNDHGRELLTQAERDDLEHRRDRSRNRERDYQPHHGATLGTITPSSSA